MHGDAECRKLAADPISPREVLLRTCVGALGELALYCGDVDPLLAHEPRPALRQERGGILVEQAERAPCGAQIRAEPRERAAP